MPRHLSLLALALTSACAAPPLDDRAVEALHYDAIVVDTHSDTTPYFQDPEFDFSARHPKTYTHMDLPRIREGGLDEHGAIDVRHVVVLVVRDGALAARAEVLVRAVVGRLEAAPLLVADGELLLQILQEDGVEGHAGAGGDAAELGDGPGFQPYSQPVPKHEVFQSYHFSSLYF